MTIQTLQQQFTLLQTQIQSIENESQLLSLKAQFLGKKSIIFEELKKMPTLSLEEKKKLGEQVNHYRILFEELFQKKSLELNRIAIQKKLQEDAIDFSLPYDNCIRFGSQHLLTKTIDELMNIMTHLGFQVVCGPEIENDFHNFTALNIPPLHPARQSQDTFYVDDDYLLRTQTSSVQIRHMKEHKPPFRIASIGKVHRVESVDQTHLPVFHQIECLCVNQDVTLMDMKNTIESMLKMFFMKNDLPIRFRSSYFPFTVPSMEVDMEYNGKWLELGGCGMVSPNVLKNVNIDENEYSGFAFGFGVERMTMIKHQVSDLRHFLENDIRFLKHYK